MKFIYALIFCAASFFAKSPFIGNAFGLDVMTEKTKIKSARDFIVEGKTETKDDNTDLAPKSFLVQLSNKFELSKYFVFGTDTFLKLNAINVSESSSSVKTKFTKGRFGYGIGIALGLYTHSINMLSVGTYCENVRYKLEDLSEENPQKPVSANKFVNGLKIENLTALSKKKFIKVTFMRPFNDKVDAFGGNHSISGTTIGLGMVVKF